MARMPSSSPAAWLSLAAIAPFGFDDRFTAKGRFERRMYAIPVKIITHPQPGLFGAAAAFAEEHVMTIDSVMRLAPVIPVLVIDEAIDPIALAETLVEAGLPVIEVTLRTPYALDALKVMARVPGAVVGGGDGAERGDARAGTGCRIGVHRFARTDRNPRPRRHRQRRSASPASPMPASIMRGLDLGLDRFQILPRRGRGGLKALGALAGPFGEVRFCLTGGIREDSAVSWLGHPLVLGVGGSRIVAPGDDLQRIATKARRAAELGAPATWNNHLLWASLIA